MSAEGSSPASGQYTAPLLAASCLAVLGGLSAPTDDAGQVVGLAVPGLALGALAVPLLSRAATFLSPAAAADSPVVAQAVGRGFMLLLPFTALAVLAEGLLDWNAAGAFAAAGIMVGASSAGAETAAVTGAGWRGTLPCTAAGFGLVGAWVLVTALLQHQIAGGPG